MFRCFDNLLTLDDSWISLLVVDSTFVFWSSEAHVDEHIPFQISLSVADESPISLLPISELRIYHSSSDVPLVVKHEPSEGTETTVEFINVGNVSASSSEPGLTSGNLSWREDSSLVLSGSIISETSQTLQVLHIVSNMRTTVDYLGSSKGLQLF